jgi:hypothetical protein
MSKAGTCGRVCVNGNLKIEVEENLMSELSSYEQLGVSENATFEEIQQARQRLSDEYSGDRKQLDRIEAAYDEILMQRLRARQEGKIKVPERIRFAEREVRSAPPSPPAPPKEAPAWLQGLLDTPSQAEILWPAGTFFALSALSLIQPASASLALAVGVGFSLYFINRKENKFGRAATITLVTLIVGLLLGTPIASWLTALGVQLPTEGLAASFAFFILWLANSFLR